MWGGFIDLHIGAVIKAVYGITGFVTEARDRFSQNQLDIEFRACGNRRSLRGFHSSREYYFGFCPIDGGVMTYQPIIAEDNRVTLIQFSNIELHPVGFTGVCGKKMSYGSKSTRMSRPNEKDQRNK